MAKKAFLLYTDMRESMSMLTNEEAGVLFKAILDYAADGKPFATDNRLLEYAFSVVKQQLDRDADKYETIRSKRANAGAEGAKKRWQKASAKEQQAIAVQEGKEAVETASTEAGTGSTNTKDDAPKGYEKFSFAFVEAEYKEAFLTWLEYKRERGEKFKAQSSLEAAYKKLVSLCNSDSSKAAAIVENSMANNWAGLFELKESAQQSNAKRREGDFTTMKVSQEYKPWEKR